MLREIIFDTETTGLRPDDGDRIVEIGAIELVNRVETGRYYHCYINPERPMPPDAQAVHGLSDAFLSDKPLFGAIVEEFLTFIGDDARLVAHNASFDFGFIDAELVRAGHPPLHRDRMVDTLAIARKRHPGAKLSLDALCTRYGIDRSRRVKHGALLDAELLAQLYVELIGGRQIGLHLVTDADAAAMDAEVSAIAATAMLKRIERPFRAPRVFQVSAADLANHRAFIADIQDCLWGDAPMDADAHAKGGTGEAA